MIHLKALSVSYIFSAEAHGVFMILLTHPFKMLIALLIFKCVVNI